MSGKTASTPNSVYAGILVDSLARSGLKKAVIAPGSRNTPLVLAFHAHPDITVYSLIDERSAAFFALGMALSDNQPTALLCSSGTAGANFYPAVIEARYANVPLLVLTADRPHELRHSGANQTIDQIKLYGDHVLWAVDMPLPEPQPTALSLRHVRSTAARAYAKTMGIECGPVHINLPFRKPLEPQPGETLPSVYKESDDAATTVVSEIWQGQTGLHRSQVDAIVRLLGARGVIICGPRAKADYYQANIARLAQTTGYPVIVDPLSNLSSASDYAQIRGFESFPLDALPDDPEIVIHFGAMPVSKKLETYLDSISTVQRIWVNPRGQWHDPQHRASMLVQADVDAFCEAIAAHLETTQTTPLVNTAWLERWQALETTTWAVLRQTLPKTFFDGSAVSMVLDTLQESDAEAIVFAANSLAVRHMVQYALPGTRVVRCFANRGASGIDGNISTALGLAVQNPDHQVVALIGDLAFYHDLNGLLAVKRAAIDNIVFVLLNNDGGGIFQRLPIAQHEPPFTDLFLTPHGLEFEPVIRMYGLPYTRAESLTALRQAVSDNIAARQAAVIEVRTEIQDDYQRWREIQELVQTQIKQINYPA